MVSDPHIVSSFDNDLKKVESLVLEMAGLVEVQVKDCVTCLLRQDLELVSSIRASDKRVDKLELDISDMAIRILVQRQPMAQDMRAVVAALKMVSNLERIGDYAKNVAKRASVVTEMVALGSSEKTITRMSELVQEMIRGVVDAYVSRDIGMADHWREKDEEVDLFHNTLFRELLTYMMENPRNITSCMHLLFIAKNFERMGDHTTNIAEQVHYIVSGSLPDDDRPKSDVTSSITADINSQV
jgi:phosphate transport system protein